MKFIFAIVVTTSFLFGCNPSDSNGSANDGHLYLRTLMWSTSYGLNLDISWIFLGNDGQILVNPKYGVNPIDWEKEKEDNAGGVGTYEEEDGKLKITWSNGKTGTMSFTKEDGNINIIEGGIITEPDAVPADYKLKGKYAISTVLPNVANVLTLVFSKNGTFKMNRMGTVETEDISGTSEDSNKGSYDITGNTLTLEFDNGDVQKSVIAIWEPDGKKNLVINNRYFPLEK